ncbi:chaperone protein dnaJ 8, chloroplastic-like [Phoenix dactylifera]|uniref:Chaperone protein dnaJ 8, chloroplastic-like n=1 Tax=Phoenix dactylifera TaxID=42345 RepID=A0A8B7CAI9_PHODC|nr:chaperone protein dnaJ 8, chloroplastic-like [Phoenix dactylifera]
MAISMGTLGSIGASSSASWVGGRTTWGRRKGAERGVWCSAAAVGSLREQYRTLRIEPGASEKEVKKAFRQLALQYHPDVCKGGNCRVQFHRINEAYDIVISSLREAEEEGGEQWESQEWSEDGYGDEPMRGMCDASWDLWEEWMGWEGAGIRDYSSHINPYI